MKFSNLTSVRKGCDNPSLNICVCDWVGSYMRCDWVGKLADGEAAGIGDSEDVVGRTASRQLRCGVVRRQC